MWTRSELKTDARTKLADSYWMGFLACLIIMGIESVGGSVSALIPAVGPLALAILVMLPIEVGMFRWFSRNREALATPPLEQLFSLFRGSAWGGVIGGMLWMALFLFLWSLIMAAPILVMISVLGGFFWNSYQSAASPDVLYAAGSIAVFLAFIACSIPFFVKYYSYRLTPWILADNPAIGYQRALRLSIDLTRGHRWSMFVLDLSFLGWWLLGLLACGVGILFVYPYYLATWAELYARLRQNGAAARLCTMEELGFFSAGGAG